MRRCFVIFTLIIVAFLGLSTFSVGADSSQLRSQSYFPSGRGATLQSSSISSGAYGKLVIGVNRTHSDACSGLSDLVNCVGGKIIDEVATKGEPLALVADVPASSYSLLEKMAVTLGLSRYVQRSVEFRVQFTPNDPYYYYQWAPKRIEADWAWNVTTGNSTVLVAVIDTGIDYSHPDLVGNYVPLGFNWVDNNSDPRDDYGHGTHVAGILAATINNVIGVAGVAQVHIMAEKGLNATGWGEDVGLAKAIIHAVDQNATILSNSWGSDTDSWLIHDAIRYAYDHNVLIVASAGNAGSNAPAYPAAYPEVISVAASDQIDNPASFSNWGDWIELSAPGVNIFSTMPTYPVTLNAQGHSMDYAFLSGTSMACPQVSGVAALISSRFPNASRNWVREQLRLSADDLGIPGFDELFGFGRVNARKAVSIEPSQHDIVLYSYERPRSIQPEDTVSFDATILNFGMSSETSLTVQLLINSTITDSAEVSYLPTDSFASVNLQWHPETEGTYNVTFYVEPIPGETIIENNVISTAVKVRFSLELNPPTGPIGTVVLVSGIDFTPTSLVAVTFNDMFIGSVVTDTYGEFSFTFNVPVSSPGTQLVKAYDYYINETAHFTVLDVTPLDVQAEVGALHFSGEIVTFYVQASFKGNLVNATIVESLLYKPDGTTTTVTIEPIATGIYKGSYTLPTGAETGSYALTVTAGYVTDTVESLGNSFKAFLVSPTLAGWNALLVGLNGTVATVKTDLGLVQVQFDQINASLANFSGSLVTLDSTLGKIQTDLDTIRLNVTAISGTTATIQTVLGVINGTITSITDQTATIIVPGMGEIKTDISRLMATREVWTVPQYVILIVACTAAAAAILSAAKLKGRKSFKQEGSIPPGPPA